MKKLLVTGGSGLLGSNIIYKSKQIYDTTGTYLNNPINFENCKLIKMDITKKDNINEIKKIGPDFIIHCAAYVNVDGCESQPELARKVNVTGTKNIVKVAEETGSFLIHISTDAVFDGKKGNYLEEDKTNPINVYGKTKLDAEREIQKSNLDYCIVRTNIYGWNAQNKFSLAEWMIDKFSKEEELPSFYDVTTTPIIVNNLTDALFEIYEKKNKGIINVAGTQSCTKLEFAQNIAEIFNFDKGLIKPISIDEFNLPAKRGKNISLNTNKAQSCLKTKLYDVKTGLKEMKRLKDTGYLERLKDL